MTDTTQTDPIADWFRTQLAQPDLGEGPAAHGLGRVVLALGNEGYNAARGVWNAVKLPGQVMQGQAAPSPENAAQFGMTMAGLGLGGGRLAATEAIPELEPVEHDPFYNVTKLPQQPAPPSADYTPRYIPYRVPSNAEKLPDSPYMVFDARKQSGYAGMFPTEQGAQQFIAGHPEGKYLDYGTPRTIEHLNPSGPDDPEYEQYVLHGKIMNSLQRVMGISNDNLEPIDHDPFQPGAPQ